MGDAELRERLDAFKLEKLGLVVIDREPHPTSSPAPDDLHAARAGVSVGERDVVALR